MTPQRPNYPHDYRNGSQHPHDRPNDLADSVTDKFKEVTDGLQDRVGQVAEHAVQYAEMAQNAVKEFKPFVQKSLKEQPMATLAGFALVGFVLGAMWKK
jgi:ElaB/YqjD/DUF883 family membrane-anchored ribosome-binding protein